MAQAPENIFSCFRDRVVFITGAGGTLGSECATHCARYGACLVLIDNNAERLEGINLRLKEAGHPEEKILARIGDVTQDDDVYQLVDDTIAKFGKINHLINIVGSRHLGDLERTTQEKFEKNFLDVSVTFRVTKACLPHLEKSKGTVVNMSAVAALVTYRDALPYGMAKAGLNHMTKVLAADLVAKGIRVNCVCPSLVYCDYTIRHGVFKTKEELEKYFSTPGLNPMGRVSRPEEVAKPILFLSSDAASFITGAILPIDGGYTLRTKYSTDFYSWDASK